MGIALQVFDALGNFLGRGRIDRVLPLVILHVQIALRDNVLRCLGDSPVDALAQRRLRVDVFFVRLGVLIEVFLAFAQLAVTQRDLREMPLHSLI